MKKHLKKKTNSHIKNSLLVCFKVYNYFKNMAEESITHKVRFKNMNETRNCLTEEINRNKLISKKHKNVCATLNYIEYFLILGSAITGCFHFRFHFFSLCSNRNYEFCNWIKNLWDNCRN